MSDTPQNPPRLAHEGDEVGRILSGAEPEFRRGLSESGAFRRVERARRQRLALSWALGATAVVGAAVLGSRTMDLGAGPDRFALSPEPIAPQPKVAPADPPKEPAPALSRQVAEPVKAEAPAEAPSAPPTEALCQKLVAQGRGERSVDCYRTLGRGDGVTSEVALYNAARISFEGLHDATRALTLLGEHQRRFPASALRAEVGWLTVRSLHAARRTDEALATSEALLASPAGRALSGDLHFLRARIYQDERGDCARAVSELVALVGEPGERGDEAELRRARCLEQLGRSTDARAAYQHYLERPDARHVREARERLSTLSD